MNISVIAFAVMAAVTILFLAATVILEWKSSLLFKTPKRDFPAVENPECPVTLFKVPILQIHSSTEPDPEIPFSNFQAAAD
jgi:hypothetical protein